jgi:hypothetical protein
MATVPAILSAAIIGLVRSGAAGSIASSADRMAKVGLCAIVAAVLLTASVGCALAALWIWDVPRLGPAGAPLPVAGILLAGCLAAIVLMRHTARLRQAPSSSNATPELLLAEAVRLLKDHKGAVLMAALIAGLMAGRSEK